MILNGDADGAAALTRLAFPKVLNERPQLLYMLKVCCTQHVDGLVCLPCLSHAFNLRFHQRLKFIEMVREGSTKGADKV